MTKTKELRNHVVRSDGFLYGTWGRGICKADALKNAGIKLNDGTPYTYFHFANDNWDIYDDGRVTWASDDDLVSMERFENGCKKT